MTIIQTSSTCSFFTLSFLPLKNCICLFAIFEWISEGQKYDPMYVDPLDDGTNMGKAWSLLMRMVINKKISLLPKIRRTETYTFLFFEERGLKCYLQTPLCWRTRLEPLCPNVMINEERGLNWIVQTSSLSFLLLSANSLPTLLSFCRLYVVTTDGEKPNMMNLRLK